MLKFSRINRSIITILYLVFMCVMSVVAFKADFVSDIRVNTLGVVIYLVIFVLSVCFYQVFKRKIKEKTGNEKICLLYKSLYLAVLVIISRIVMAFVFKNHISTEVVLVDNVSLSKYILDFIVNITHEAKYAPLILNSLFTFINAMLIKQIMTNLLDNDAVATTAAIAYMLTPLSLINSVQYNSLMFNTTFVLLGLLLINKIYDEIINYGDKSTKYIILTLILSLVVSLDILFGGSLSAWVIILLVLFVTTDYVDGEYIKRFEAIKKILKGSKEIVIKKSIIVLVLVVIIASIVSGIVYGLGLNNIGVFVNDNWIETLNTIFGPFRVLFIILGIIVALSEIVSFALKRKNGTKVVLVQTMILIYGLISVLYVNEEYGLCIFEALFSMSFLLSTGNIYYNRNEKIKLLKAKN
ncbi:MAG: hypothetical protein IKV94_02365 [Clostridia bacterium]|nr:hypothetical protein [Clostridia bacterium]